MAEIATALPAFQMVGARAAVLDGPSANALEQQIYAIENALTSVPDFAFDLSKTLVESVCKTVLGDLGRVADSNWTTMKLLRETTDRMALLPRGHPDPARARDAVEKTLRGLFQTLQGLCELRNGYGLASHGRDGYSARLDLRQATLAAQAADTIVSFLYRIHRDAQARAPGARVYYEDHTEFNEAFDRENETIRVSELGLRPSEVLCMGDPEAYKAALIDYLGERTGSGDATDDDTLPRPQAPVGE